MKHACAMTRKATIQLSHKETRDGKEISVSMCICHKVHPVSSIFIE